ncbi:MAG TPA: hypothetical protein PLC80_00955 [Draconibacterium sp.]|nr:hypothetical protein [Draconibacterium sp.]
MFYPLFSLSTSTVVKKFQKWIFGQWVVLLTFLIAVYLVIVGIYGRVFSETPPNYWLNPVNHIEFIEEQKNNNPLQYISLDHPEYYNHLLIIDRTLSTLNSEDTMLQNFLINRYNRKLNDSNSNVLKALILLNICNDLFKSKINRNLRILFYDGDSIFTDATYEINKTNEFKIENNWFTLNDENSKALFFNQLTKIQLEINKKDRKTIFENVLKKIPEVLSDTTGLNKNNEFVVTIISDFIDESVSMSSKKIEKYLQSNNKLTQINFIHLVPRDLSKSEGSIELLNLIKSKISGIQFNKTPIDINQKWTNDKLDILDKELIQCFLMQPDPLKIDHYYPTEQSERGFKTTKAILKIEDKYNTNKNPWFWRIMSPYSQQTTITPVFYEKNKSKNRLCVYVDDKEFHEIGYNDTLYLYFPINNYIYNNQYELEILQGDITKVFSIQFREKIPKYIASLAGWIIHLFMILVFLCMCLLAFRPVNIIKFCYKNSPSEVKCYKLRQSFYIDFSIFIVALIFVILYTKWIFGNYNFLIKGICIIIFALQGWLFSFQIANWKAIINLKKNIK